MEALFLLWNQQAGTLRRPAFQNLMRTLRILQRIFLLLGDIALITPLAIKENSSLLASVNSSRVVI